MEKMDRIPPHSLDAERAILGAIFLDNRVLSRIQGIMRDEDFYHETHKRIFRYMVALKEKDEPIDPVTLGTILMDNGELDRVGGALAINDLTDGVATTANVEHYARLVSHKAVVRRMIYAAQEIVTTGYSGYEDFDDFINSSRSAIVSAAAGAVELHGRAGGRGDVRARVGDGHLVHLHGEAGEGRAALAVVAGDADQIRHAAVVPRAQRREGEGGDQTGGREGGVARRGLREAEGIPVRIGEGRSLTPSCT